MDPIVQPTGLPICVSIPGGLRPNRFIVIDGFVPTNSAVGFSIKLQCGLHEVDDIAMCFNMSFMQKKTFFSINSFLNRKWGVPAGSLGLENSLNEIFNDKRGEIPDNTETTKDINQSSVPLHPGEYCGILFDCRENCFSISVKSKHICDFPHRTKYSRITHLVLTGEFIVVQAGVTGGTGPTKWLIYATGLYIPWQQDHVTVLNDTIFEQAVLKSDDLWLVAFYLNSCSFHADFEFAATELIEKFHTVTSFGVMDCLVNLDTVLRLKVKQCPTILCFVSGHKSWESAQEYDGEYSEKGFIEWILFKIDKAYGKSPGFGSPRPPTEPIRTIQRDSWMYGPPPLLPGAGKPLEGECYLPANKSLTFEAFCLLDNSETASKYAMRKEDEAGPSTKEDTEIEPKDKDENTTTILKQQQQSKLRASSIVFKDDVKEKPSVECKTTTSTNSADAVRMERPSAIKFKDDEIYLGTQKTTNSANTDKMGTVTGKAFKDDGKEKANMEFQTTTNPTSGRAVQSREEQTKKFDDSRPVQEQGENRSLATENLGLLARFARFCRCARCEVL